MYPAHENDSGVFQELVRKKDVKFGQLSYLLIRPGFSRGDHYHTRKEEWFICMRGKCELHVAGVKSNKRKRIVLDSSRKELVKVSPFERHVLKNLSHKENCEVLIIMSEEFDEKDSDTHKVG